MSTVIIILLLAVVIFLIFALIMVRQRFTNLKKSLEEGRMSMYDQLQNAEEDKNRLKRQLTQNVAHELKTPVSSIQGYLETIVSDPDMDEEVKNHFIQRCFIQSQRLSSLLQDISTLNKLDDAPESYEREPINILTLFNTILSDVTQKLKEKNITVRTLIGPDVVVVGSHSLLYSIFRNLTDNAIAYAGEGVTVTVQVLSEDENYYTFSFADNGVGVAAEHLPHLFERFYRVDKGRSRKMGGTGLGLAIVKNAVLLHHGSISVRLAQTGGLEFIFSLPKAGT
ncbi:MAG: ATP-binding protein [Bacteroidales bacterium]|jgi:two-component system OmpR family sensor kinase/two-component system phosphate regulon sensor histidine kinase PhoR|nr:ATP-binding protein [Bacteroidales bacterium]